MLPLPFPFPFSLPLPLPLPPPILSPSSFFHLSSFYLPHLIVVLYFLIVLSPLLSFTISHTLIPPTYLTLSLSLYLSIASPLSYHYYLSTSTFCHLRKHGLIVTAPDSILPAHVVPLGGLHVPQG